MNKIHLSLLLFAVFALSASCVQDTDTDSGAIQTPARYREMVAVIPEGETVPVPGAGTEGVFVAGRAVRIGAFRMAKYETVWELWKEIRGWALGHGYRIAGAGTEGHGAGTGGGRPVTDISWRDAVVWCNAYSERSGLEPVYYAADGVTVLRESRGNTPDAPSRTDTAADLAVMCPEKNGFRLPLETEWEFAARGGSPSGVDWSLPYAGSGDISAVAWYEGNAYIPEGGSYGIHPAGTKAPNSAGIFDLSGNAAEWVWDWFHENGVTPQTPPEGGGPGAFAHRATRGGSWRSGAEHCAVSARNYCRPFAGGTYLGFRLAQSIPPE